MQKHTLKIKFNFGPDMWTITHSEVKAIVIEDESRLLAWYGACSMYENTMDDLVSMELVDDSAEVDDLDVLLHIGGHAVAGERGELVFTRSEDCAMSGLSSSEVFVSFQDTCIDIIEFGTDLEAYIDSPRLVEKVRDSWLDRNADID